MPAFYSPQLSLGLLAALTVPASPGLLGASPQLQVAVCVPLSWLSPIWELSSALQSLMGVNRLGPYDLGQGWTGTASVSRAQAPEGQGEGGEGSREDVREGDH